jgi:hypothetical protein
LRPLKSEKWPLVGSHVPPHCRRERNMPSCY